MSTDTFKPFLINKDVEGNFRLTVRDRRYNSQGYPLISSTLQEPFFKTAAAAKVHAQANFNAKAGEYCTK